MSAFLMFWKPFAASHSILADYQNKKTRLTTRSPPWRPGSPKYRSLPKSIQADIKAFFRSNAAAQDEGRRLLFATGDRAGIRRDIETALAAQLGGLRHSDWFRFRPRERHAVAPADFLLIEMQLSGICVRKLRHAGATTAAGVRWRSLRTTGALTG